MTTYIWVCLSDFYDVDLIKQFADGSDQFKWVSSIDKELFVRSQHFSMINGLLGRYPLYGPVVR